MPRINIDEKLFADPRFKYLESKIGYEMAIGQCVKLWFLAQKYYVPNRQAIPGVMMTIAGLPVSHLLDCGLIDEADGGFVASGCEDQFNWLFKSIENGKKGGRRTHGLPMGKAQLPQRVTTSSSSSSSSNTVATTATKKESKQVGRVLESGEVDNFIENLRANLEIARKPVGRGLAVQLLRTFDNQSEAEDWLGMVFKSASSKTDDVDGKVKYIQAAMASHIKQEAQANGN